MLAEHGIDVRTPDAASAPARSPTVSTSSCRWVVTAPCSAPSTSPTKPASRCSGVNVGQLGYLTEVEPQDLPAALERVIAGDYEVTERMVLEITVESDGPARGKWYALNEAVLEKVHTGRLVRLEVEINGAPFTTYAADGVIVATPTGSTAYSFSARGPIVSPRHRCLLLTPVSPHMLFDRSLVLDADESVRFVVCDDRSVVLTADGLELGNLAGGDAVSCTGGKHPARIVTLGLRDFHQILKAKFGLSDR